MSGYTWKELATDKADESRVWIDDIILQEEFGVDVKLSSLEPMTPDLRNQAVVIPGRAGAYDMGAELEPRVFQLDCVFPRQSYKDLKTESRRLTALFFDQFGKPREVKLRMGDEPEKWYRVRVTEGITPTRTAERGHFSAVLTAFDPYAYALIYADELTWGSEVVTFRSTEYTYGHESTGGYVEIKSPTKQNISVTGYAVRPIIEISGSSDGMSIENIGQIIDLPAFSDARWLIDCERYTATKDGSNVFDVVRLRDFWLYEGLNELDISGRNIDINLRVKFRDRWL